MVEKANCRLQPSEPTEGPMHLQRSSSSDLSTIMKVKSIEVLNERVDSLKTLQTGDRDSLEEIDVRGAELRGTW